MPKERIHIFGASGSGTTTLGRAVADSLQALFLDADDFYWVPTDPPYRQKRDLAERQRLLGAELRSSSRWVLSGSLVSWGDVFVPMFELVVFLSTPWEVRLSRLRQREQERYGAESLQPGGSMHEEHEAFIEWASKYDHGGMDVRSRLRHEQWLAELPPTCEVLRLDGELSIATLANAVVECATA